MGDPAHLYPLGTPPLFQGELTPQPHVDLSNHPGNFPGLDGKGKEALWWGAHGICCEAGTQGSPRIHCYNLRKNSTKTEATWPSWGCPWRYTGSGIGSHATTDYSKAVFCLFVCFYLRPPQEILTGICVWKSCASTQDLFLVKKAYFLFM